MNWRLRESWHASTGLKYWALILPSGKEIGLAPWCFDILHNNKPIFILDGGRKSGKSIAVAQTSIMKAAGMTQQYVKAPKPPVRTLVLRAAVKSLKHSVQESLWGWIEEFGLQDDFKRTENMIKHRWNGSEYVFEGLKNHTKDSIRSFVDFDECWIEEGQEITVPVWETLEPTIRRKNRRGRMGRFIITMNRRFYSDALDVKVLQKIKSRTDAVRMHINYIHNPFLEREEIEDIEAWKRIDPARFNHIWLGEPDMEGHLPLLINARMVTDCFMAYKQFKKELEVFTSRSTKGEGGLDIAGQGENFNCLLFRRGPVVTQVKKWNKVYDHVTYRRTYGYSVSAGVGDIWYDGSGVGAGFTSRYAEAKEEHYQETRILHYPIKCVPENNGGEVRNKTLVLAKGITNEGAFQYRGDQMAQMLVIRMENTQRLLDGEDVPLENCLFFSDRLDDSVKADLMRMLTQPTVERDKRNRMHIKKMDESKGQESPDEFDALRLAFGRDSENGISMKRWT